MSASEPNSAGLASAIAKGLLSAEALTWGKLGTISWLLEGAFCLALIAFAKWRNGTRGVSYKWAIVVLVLLFLQMSPWLSPMKWVAQLSEPAAHLLHGMLVTIGFLIPGLLLTWLINRAEHVPV